MNIHEIKSLMEKGEYDEALMQIEQSESNALDLKILKSMVLRYKELFNASLSIANDVFSESINLQSKIHEFAALTQIAYGLFITQKTDQSQEYISKIEDIWDALTDEQKENAKEWESYIYHVKAGICALEGEYDKAISLNKKTLELREQINDKLELQTTLNNLGIVYSNIGEYDNEFECVKQQLTISEELGNKDAISFAYQRLGHCYVIKGEYNQAREYFKKRLKISNENNFRYSSATATGNLAWLSYREGEYKQALRYFTTSLSIYEDLNLDIFSATTLYYLILTSLKMKSGNLADNYFQKLKRLSVNSKNEIINTAEILAKALILKSKPRSKDKIESQKILEEIIKENTDFDFTLDAILHLSELLLDELKLYGRAEVLEEIDALTREIYELAQTHQLYPLIIRILVLRAKLSFLKMDMEKADKILQQAYLMAEERGLDRLLNFVKQEESRMGDEITLASEISKSAITIQERLEKSKIFEYIVEMQNLIRSQ
ncbi:MAG: tetratricopeptide repeat protein [Candidatus Kariarchaeaceae archaeon]|jgi:tetratricopeptide (TPR) repeat protein